MDSSHPAAYRQLMGSDSPGLSPAMAHSADSGRSLPVNDTESPELLRQITQAETESVKDEREAALLDDQDFLTSSFSSQIHAPTTDEEGATVTSVTLNLIGGGLGTGILSMPWGMAGGSIFVALGVLAVVLGINAFTIMILIYAGEKHQQFELGCLLAMLPGKMMGKGFGHVSQILSNILVWATLWGVLVGYCIVIQQQIVPFMPEDSHLLSDKKLWAAAGTLVVIPLCFLNTKYLSFTSFLSVMVNVYLFGVLIALFSHATEKEEKHFCYLGFGPGIVTFMSLMQYGVIIQFCVLPMYKEMKDRRPAAFGKALTISFSFLFCLFSLFAVIGYMCFGAGVDSDILTNYPGSHDKNKTTLNVHSLEWVSNVAKAGMVLVVLGVYPLMMLPMISPVREYEKRVAIEAFKNPKASYEGLPGPPGGLAQQTSALHRLVKGSPRLLSSASIVFIAITACACSFVVSGLGELNAVSGAAQASFFVGIFPSLIAWHLLDKKESMRWRIGLFVLAMVCCLLSLMGFVFIKNNADKIDPESDGNHCWISGSVGGPN